MIYTDDSAVVRSGERFEFFFSVAKPLKRFTPRSLSEKKA